MYTWSNPEFEQPKLYTISLTVLYVFFLMAAVVVYKKYYLKKPLTFVNVSWKARLAPDVPSVVLCRTILFRRLSSVAIKNFKMLLFSKPIGFMTPLKTKCNLG